ncbi:MAG: hypothetical protein AB7S41_10635 [Parvibaculaceae bacterium]
MRRATDVVILGVAISACVLSGSLLANVTPSSDGVPRAVTIARTTTIPGCSLFVDAAAKGGGDGTAQNPFGTIAAAVDAADPGAVICVAEGTYAETLAPGEKHFTLAGGFQSGQGFALRDSARHVTRAQGNGGSFLRIEDPGPRGDQLTAIDGFEITGYSQAIYRAVYYSQRFDITNNFIHDNVCADASLVGGGFALENVTGVIKGNVFLNNRCGRGGAGFVNDATNENTVSIENNRIEGNAGTEPDSSHGGAIYLFVNKVDITGNLFVNNSVTQWGGGLYVGASGGQQTSATLAWNVYRGNRAGNGGGGFFCDDGAKCVSAHEIHDGNCGGNILLDSGYDGTGATIASFDQLTNVNALDVECAGPGPGVRVDKGGPAPDAYAFTNALFWGNGKDADFITACGSDCGAVTVQVAHSMVQTTYQNNGVSIAFGDGIVVPVDPLFADPKGSDFHLRSAAGRWTETGHVQDDTTSPAIARGDPARPARGSPARAGDRRELGAYGDSSEASYVE